MNIMSSARGTNANASHLQLQMSWNVESLTLHTHFEHFFFLPADSLLAASPQEAYIIKCNLSSVWWILGYLKKKCWKKQTCCWTPCPESISQPNVPDNCWSPASPYVRIKYLYARMQIFPLSSASSLWLPIFCLHPVVLSDPSVPT